MSLPRTTAFWLIAVVMAALPALTPAWAQGFQPSQGFPQNAAPAQQQQQQQQQPPCYTDFLKLRTETEQKANAVKTASARHATAAEACKLFNSFIATEAKMIKYVEENSTWCGIPPQVLTQMKTGHASASGIRTKVCQAAARGPVSSGPTLSDALGTNRVPSASNVQTGRGTYDTLTGSPLAR